MKITQNIKFKLTAWYLVVLVIVLLFFSVMADVLLGQNLSHRSVSIPDINVIELTGIPDNDGPELPAPLAGVFPPVKFEQQSDWEHYGRPFASYPMNRSGITEANEFVEFSSTKGRLILNQSALFTPELTGIQEVKFYISPVKSESGSYQVIAVLTPTGDINEVRSDFEQILLIALPVTIVFAGVLGLLLARQMLKPVDSITKIAQDIQEKDLSRRIDVKGDDELGRLSRTLNQMFERLEKAFSREREFIANASHQLRTPVSIIRAEATLALRKERTAEDYRKSLRLISDEASHLSGITDKLLALAGAEARTGEPVIEQVDLKGLLGELAATVKGLGDNKDVGLNFDLPDSVTVSGDKARLRELFLNLTDNAIRYNKPDGCVKVSLRRKDGEAIVTVEDTGIGIPEEHLPHLFQRFYRVNGTPENLRGTGLGLSICKSIAEAHGGRIEVKSRVGDGSTFTVTLPVGDKE